MTNKAPAVQPGYIYNKSETAQLLGISRGTLRKYTRLNRIEAQFHPLTGAEFYTAEEILRAWGCRVGQRITQSSYVTAQIGRMNIDGQRSSSFETRISRFKNRGK